MTTPSGSEAAPGIAAAQRKSLAALLVVDLEKATDEKQKTLCLLIQKAAEKNFPEYDRYLGKPEVSKLFQRGAIRFERKDV